MNKLKNKLVIYILVFAIFVLHGVSTANSAIITFNFDSTSTSSFLNGSSYSEGGFTFSVSSGDHWGFDESVGNALVVGFNNSIGIGDTINVSANNEGDFKFLNFDFASFSSNISDGVNFVGRNDGVTLFTLSNIFSSTPLFSTSNFGFSESIDELLIVGASQGSEELLLDNFVFETTAIPVPPAFILFATGLIGLLRIFKHKEDI